MSLMADVVPQTGRPADPRRGRTPLTPGYGCGCWLDERPHQPTRQRVQPLPAPARPQPGRLVSVGRRGVRARPARAAPGAAEHRLLRLSLVPRDGARVVRESGDRGADE